MDGRKCAIIDNDLGQNGVSLQETGDPTQNHRTVLCPVQLVREGPYRNDSSGAVAENTELEETVMLADELKRTLEKISTHIDSLSTDSSNKLQLEHLRRAVFNRVDNYLSDVQ